ncbi:MULTISPECIES: hypothetical protein [Anaeromyxobacter]|uniref:hypothetical protein n=1 Tax=Anaeromyxobacter TaxID=161492 RepID=UPI001F59B8F8|nr:MULTISPECIES: hypothetical protein [unclassified Anaeromyxobacter]
MRTCEEMVALACKPHTPEFLHSDEASAWARAADLIVGAINASPETWASRVDNAYDRLGSPPVVLRREDLWSLVLLIELPTGTSDAVKRHIERETRGSRKLAFSEDEDVPSLFAQSIGRREANPGAASPTVVEDTLAQFCAGDSELRRGLEVLLKPRQPREEVDALIRILSGEPGDAN